MSTHLQQLIRITRGKGAGEMNRLCQQHVTHPHSTVAEVPLSNASGTFTNIDDILDIKQTFTNLKETHTERQQEIFQTLEN